MEDTEKISMALPPGSWPQIFQYMESTGFIQCGDFINPWSPSYQEKGKLELVCREWFDCLELVGHGVSWNHNAI